jgi:hypothetical protein
MALRSLAFEFITEGRREKHQHFAASLGAVHQNPPRKTASIYREECQEKAVVQKRPFLAQVRRVIA